MSSILKDMTQGCYTDTFTIKSTSQNFSTSWAVCGGENDGEGADDINIKLTIDVNGGSYFQVCLYGLTTSAGTEYIIPYSNDLYYWVAPANTDGIYTINYPYKKSFPLFKMYIRAINLGSPTAHVESAYYNASVVGKL